MRSSTICARLFAVLSFLLRPLEATAENMRTMMPATPTTRTTPAIISSISDIPHCELQRRLRRTMACICPPRATPGYEYSNDATGGCLSKTTRKALNYRSRLSVPGGDRIVHAPTRHFHIQLGDTAWRRLLSERIARTVLSCES